MRLSLPRYLNLVYFHLTENMDDEQVRKFDMKLFRRRADPNQPPAWWGDSDEEAAASGLAAARALGFQIPVMV